MMPPPAAGGGGVRHEPTPWGQTLPGHYVGVRIPPLFFMDVTSLGLYFFKCFLVYMLFFGSYELWSQLRPVLRWDNLILPL